MRSLRSNHLRLVREAPGNDNTEALVEKPVEKPTLKSLITLGIRSFPPPPWDGKSKNAEHFFEVTSIHKSKPEWAPIFAAQQVIRNAFMESLPPETAGYMSASDYERLVRFLDDAFVYMEGLYGLITNQSKQHKITADPAYVRITKLTFYPYDTAKGLKGLFQPKKLAEIETELSPLVRDLIKEVTQACANHAPFIVREGKEAGKEQHIHEIQIRHYLSLLHHFITEMTSAMANKK